MTIIQNSVDINRPIEEVYTFLADLNNHEQLMPDNITDWKSTADEAQFNIKNMAKLSLKISERMPYTNLECVPNQEAPFEVKLRWQLEDKSGVTKASFVIEAELNMMMKMLASGPLQKLVDHQVETLGKVLI